jgi:hypothetical protein
VKAHIGVANVKGAKAPGRNQRTDRAAALRDAAGLKG